MSALDEYLKKNRDLFENELIEFLRIPSVSADPRRKEAITHAADWVAGQFRAIELATEVIPTEGNPLVYAETPAVEGAATVLVYGHYDVQPADPLELWKTPPFEPAVRDGNVFARGATDDKGQMFTHIKAAQAWLQSGKRLPVRLKFLIEGEEEIGSHSLHDYLKDNAEKLACDVIVISDMSQFAPGKPAITYGLRGIACYELRLKGPHQDLHSGSYGGPVVNPALALAKILASLVDEKGRVTVPGFYEDVVPLSDRERDRLASLPFDKETFMDQISVSAVGGEAGYSLLEQRWARPTCEINGLTSGYQGDGAKTIIPSTATAKISFRLVPQQDPVKIAEALTHHCHEICPEGVTLEVVDLHGSPGVLVDIDSPAVTAAVAAIERGFGRSPVFIREGGSVPIVTEFAEQLGVDVLLLGWGLPDDNAHGPNEKFCLADFHRGIKASALLWQELGRVDLNQE